MAKKKTNSQETPALSAPQATPRRRAPVKKQTAAPPAPSPDNGHHEPSQAEIAEAAYYRHLNRGGKQGDQFNDWVEAERELRERQARAD